MDLVTFGLGITTGTAWETMDLVTVVLGIAIGAAWETIGDHGFGNFRAGNQDSWI